jgi:hypothetical protein
LFVSLPLAVGTCISDNSVNNWLLATNLPAAAACQQNVTVTPITNFCMAVKFKIPVIKMTVVRNVTASQIIDVYVAVRL